MKLCCFCICVCFIFCSFLNPILLNRFNFHHIPIYGNALAFGLISSGFTSITITLKYLRRYFYSQTITFGSIAICAVSLFLIGPSEIIGIKDNIETVAIGLFFFGCGFGLMAL